VPAATLPTRDDGQWEYLRLTVQPFDFQANDWRELTGFRHVGAPDELDPDLDYCTVENLLAKYDGKEETHEVSLDEIAVKPVDDYLFNVELAGIISYRGDEENLHLVEQLPFAEAILHVPINTTDPIAAARAKVAQAIGLKEIESARVVPADWRRKKDPAAPLASNHSIALTTRWRNHGA
jgi:hypothetical protein